MKSLNCQQTPFQLAVMDGGSSDNFLNIIKPYSDLINYQKSSPDNGQADAINQGFNTIEGDIIGWLNADDYYFPNVLNIISDFFSKHPEIDVVYGDAIHISKEGFFISYFPPIQEFDFSDLTKTCFICQPACFFRRKAFERVKGLNEKLSYTMDWDLWCRMALSGAKFHYLHQLIAAVRYYPGTKTMSGSFRRYMEIWRIEKKYGNRKLPLSWPGFFYYHLISSMNNSVLQKVLLYLIGTLRKIKKTIKKKVSNVYASSNLLYGFHRWKNFVSGKATIHLPWYHSKKWNTLILKVRPLTDQYEIHINDKPCQVSLLNDDIQISIPELDSISRTISIRCKTSFHWELNEFKIETF